MKKKDSYDPVKPEDPLEATIFLEKILNRFKINLSLPEKQLSFQWDHLIGKHLSGHCKYSGIKNGTLFVFCESSEYSTLIRINKTEIIKKINETFPDLKISKISTRIN